MNNIKLFLKGIVVGIGGIAPGLSGSVLMVILGLYTKVINALATLFKDFKKNFLYLLPLGIGMILGIVLFSRLINYSIENYELQTRLAFFGLLIGTIPLFFKEVKKNNDMHNYHYLLIGLAFIFGFYFITLSNPIAGSKDLNMLQSFILGFVGISATIVPGIDGASILSTFGLYGNWLDLTSLNNFDLAVYIPAGIGVVAGAFILSLIVNTLIKKRYTLTFSILFGLFLSIIPNILKNDAGKFITLGNNIGTYVGIVLLILGILVSWLFGKMNKDNH
jgi:putative membrane protein